MSVIEEAKEFAAHHPYALGGIAAVGVVGLYLLLHKGGSTAQASGAGTTMIASGNSGQSAVDVASIQAGAQLQAQQASIAGQLQIAGLANQQVSNTNAAQVSVVQSNNDATVQLGSLKLTDELSGLLDTNKTNLAITQDNNNTAYNIANSNNATTLGVTMSNNGTALGIVQSNNDVQSQSINAQAAIAMGNQQVSIHQADDNFAISQALIGGQQAINASNNAAAVQMNFANNVSQIDIAQNATAFAAGQAAIYQGQAIQTQGAANGIIVAHPWG